MLSQFSLVYFVPSEWRQKNVDSFERPRHGSPAAFYIPNYFQCERFAMPLDAPNPTTNQSSRLTLPTEGATQRFLKIDRQTVKKIWENWAPVTPKCQNKIQRNQLRLSGWTNLTKSIINLPFTRKSVFANFVNKQASGTPILTHQNYKAANPLHHAFSPS